MVELARIVFARDERVILIGAISNHQDSSFISGACTAPGYEAARSCRLRMYELDDGDVICTWQYKGSHIVKISRERIVLKYPLSYDKYARLAEKRGPGRPRKDEVVLGSDSAS